MGCEGGKVQFGSLTWFSPLGTLSNSCEENKEGDRGNSAAHSQMFISNTPWTTFAWFITFSETIFHKPVFSAGKLLVCLFKKILHLALQEKKKIFWGSQRAICLPWSSEADYRNLRIPCHQSLGSTLHSLCRGTPELRLLVHFSVLPSYIGIKCLRQETWLEIKRTSGRIHSNSSQTRTLHIAL